jgi:hypothetical protein
MMAAFCWKGLLVGGSEKVQCEVVVSRGGMIQGVFGGRIIELLLIKYSSLQAHYLPPRARPDLTHG